MEYEYRSEKHRVFLSRPACYHWTQVLNRQEASGVTLTASFRLLLCSPQQMPLQLDHRWPPPTLPLVRPWQGVVLKCYQIPGQEEWGSWERKIRTRPNIVNNLQLACKQQTGIFPRTLWEQTVKDLPAERMQKGRGKGKGKGKNGTFTPEAKPAVSGLSKRELPGSWEDHNRKTLRLNLYQDTQQKNLLKPTDRRRVYYSSNLSRYSLFRISWESPSVLQAGWDRVACFALLFQ